MGLVTYNTEGDPVESGVYACRIPDSICDGLLLDRFLLWYDGGWQYCGSDQRYRGLVKGWIGPLQRRLP
jgi:hypothetical protein